MSRRTLPVWPMAGVALLLLLLPLGARAQGNTPARNDNQLTQMDGRQAAEQVEEKSLGNPKAEKDYKKFHETKNLDKKIKMGKNFINRYPSSYHAESVYEELAEAYYAKHDLTNFYSVANEGLSKYPNDPTLLSVIGTTMARAYNQQDPDADAKLAKAEKYELESLELLKTLPLPRNMSEAQFASYRKQIAATANSGLGLIYFRQAKFGESVKALQQATQDATTPDPTDFLVLGGDYQNLNQFKEAANAFSRCAQIPGPLQTGCKQYAASSMKRASGAK